jgi:isoquinoline 1-oxidoreductase beta subunit
VIVRSGKVEHGQGIRTGFARIVAADDVALEAVRLSRAAGRPVLVQWSRAEEFCLSPHRPVFDAELEAALDVSGAIADWRCSVRTNSYLRGAQAMAPGAQEMTAGRDAEPPYGLGSAGIRLRVEPAEVPTISFRSLGAAPNVFAIESFIDELAHAAGQDPIGIRPRPGGRPAAEARVGNGAGYEPLG